MRKILFFLTLSLLLIGGIYPLKVVKIVDGDTVWGYVGKEYCKIRLIGIDTPEKRTGRHLYRQQVRTGKSQRKLLLLAREATNALKGLLSSCKAGLYLETDVQLYDRYGRLLGYIWCGQGEKRWMINYAMVRLGYAMVYTFPPNVKYVEAFVQAQKKAMEEKKGLWRSP